MDTFVHWFKQHYPGKVCPATPTVYRYIDDQRLPLRNQDLPMKLRRRIKHYGRHHDRTNKKIWGQSIELRPSIVEDRSEFGHWEGDLVKAKRVESEPALMTLTERFSRLEILLSYPIIMRRLAKRHFRQLLMIMDQSTFTLLLLMMVVSSLC